LTSAALVCHFDERGAGLSFRRARRWFVISTSAALVCHFDERGAGLSFRRAQRWFVISTSAALVCHFDERSAGLSFRRAQRGEIFSSSAGFHPDGYMSLRSKRQALNLKLLNWLHESPQGRV